MHKVINCTNEALLKKLDEKFISPLMQLILHSKKESVSLLTSSYYLGQADAQKKILDTGLAQIAISGTRPKKGKKKPAVKLKEYCESIANKNSLKDIEKAIKIFSDQKNKISTGDYSLKVESVTPLIHQLFVDILYVKLFDNKNIWKAVSGKEFDRNTFHENFKGDNQGLTICPYCDLDTIISKGTHEVEHFLPKSKYPLISLYFGNLFSACVGCNKPAGKGGNSVDKVANPYCVEIGERVSFEFFSSKKSISIFSNPPDGHIDGYIELINLKVRYSDKSVWDYFEKRKKALHESIQKQKFLDLTTLQEYIMVEQDGIPLKYAMKFWAKLEPAYIKAPLSITGP